MGSPGAPPTLSSRTEASWGWGPPGTVPARTRLDRLPGEGKGRRGRTESSKFRPCPIWSWPESTALSASRSWSGSWSGWPAPEQRRSRPKSAGRLPNRCGGRCYTSAPAFTSPHRLHGFPSGIRRYPASRLPRRTLIIILRHRSVNGRSTVLSIRGSAARLACPSAHLARHNSTGHQARPLVGPTGCDREATVR